MSQFKVGDRVVAKPGMHDSSYEQFRVEPGVVYEVRHVAEDGCIEFSGTGACMPSRFQLADEPKYLLVIIRSASQAGGVVQELFDSHEAAVAKGLESAHLGGKFKVAKLLDAKEYAVKKEAVPV